MQWPVTLSDASSSGWGLEQHLRDGLRGFVWFGTGFGWEDRQQRLMPCLSSIITTMAEPGCPSPKVAVICLKYGAKSAAEALHHAGIQTVMWLELAHFDKHIFKTTIVPALRALNEGRAHNIFKALHVDTTNAGCHVVEPLKEWTPPKLESELLRNLCAAEKLPETNLGLPLTKNLAQLQVLASDLEHLQDPLFASDTNVLIVSDGIEGADVRRRALALAACQSSLRNRSYDNVYRIATVQDMATIGAQLTTGSSTLLWLDLTRKVSPEDVQSINDQFQNLNDDLNVKVIITCCDECGAATPENLEEFECQQLDIEEETGVSNVFADDLHDEFKLMASWTLETSEPQPEPSASELASEPEPEAGAVPGDAPDEHHIACLTCSNRRTSWQLFDSS